MPENLSSPDPTLSVTPPAPPEPAAPPPAETSPEAQAPDQPASEAPAPAAAESPPAGEAAQAPAEMEAPAPPQPSNKHWYVVKVQSGREESIKEAIERRVKIEGLEEFYGQIVIPVERVTEMRNGKRV